MAKSHFCKAHDAHSGLLEVPIIRYDNNIKGQRRVNRYLHKVTLYLTFFVLVVLFSSVFFFMHNDKHDKLLSFGDRVVRDFRKSLDDEMANLLSFSLALSEDGELKNALMQENEEKGYRILSEITQRFKKYTHLKSLRIQVITPDFFIFARSWDEGYEGMPIWWFRDDLNVLNKKKEPKVGVEAGRLLTFKATIPIRSGQRLLGYLEVITLLDEFVSKLRKKGIELFVMMDDKYLDKAELMQEMPRLDGYVIANQNYNQQFLDILETIDPRLLQSKKYSYKNGVLWLTEPMYNGEGRHLGYYVIAVPKDMIELYRLKDPAFSLFTQFSDEDIEKVVYEWDSPAESYRTIKDKSLIEILPKLHQEDKNSLEQKAKRILQTYSKEELIDIILSSKHKEQKKGEIQ